jgi:hypothetical protein
MNSDHLRPLVGKIPGDPAPAIGYLARLPRTRAVIAVNQPRTAVGHASTQFQLLGPDGDPPPMYRRTIAAHAEDGRWSWYESGEPLPFEHPERYAGSSNLRGLVTLATAS